MGRRETAYSIGHPGALLSTGRPTSHDMQEASMSTHPGSYSFKCTLQVRPSSGKFAPPRRAADESLPLLLSPPLPAFLRVCKPNYLHDLPTVQCRRAPRMEVPSSTSSFLTSGRLSLWHRPPWTSPIQPALLPRLKAKQSVFVFYQPALCSDALSS